MKTKRHRSRESDIQLEQIQLNLQDGVGLTFFISGVMFLIVGYMLRMYPPCGSYAHVLGTMAGMIMVRHQGSRLLQLPFGLASDTMMTIRESTALDRRLEQVVQETQSTPLIVLVGLCIGVVGFLYGGGVSYDSSTALMAIERFGWYHTIIRPTMICWVFSISLLLGLNMFYVKWQLEHQPNKGD